MGWDIEELDLRLGSQRVQARADATSNKHGQIRRATAANTAFTRESPRARRTTVRGKSRVTRDDERVGKGNQGFAGGNGLDEIVREPEVPDGVKYQRRRRKGSPDRHDYSTCEGFGGEACEKAIRQVHHDQHPTDPSFRFGTSGNCIYSCVAFCCLSLNVLQISQALLLCLGYVDT